MTVMLSNYILKVLWESAGDAADLPRSWRRSSAPSTRTTSTADTQFTPFLAEGLIFEKSLERRAGNTGTLHCAGFSASDERPCLKPGARRMRGAFRACACRVHCELNARAGSPMRHCLLLLSSLLIAACAPAARPADLPSCRYARRERQSRGGGHAAGRRAEARSLEVTEGDWQAERAPGVSHASRSLKPAKRASRRDR